MPPIRYNDKKLEGLSPAEFYLQSQWYSVLFIGVLRGSGWEDDELSVVFITQSAFFLLLCPGHHSGPQLS